MESYEVLKEAVANLGAKNVASRLGLSTSLVYKWCQEPNEEILDGHSGARNPLDRVLDLMAITENPVVISWLCAQVNGVFIPNPEPVDREHVDATVIGSTQEMLKEFSDVLDEVSRALADDQGVDQGEAKRIRREWEQLKAKAEGFVAACEAGAFEK